MLQTYVRKERNIKTTKVCVRFCDNAKGEVNGVLTIAFSSSCDLLKVYMVEGLKHSLFNISQLCDAGFQVTFNIISCIIKRPEKKHILIGDRVNKTYILNNLFFHPLQLIAVSTDPWL